jgi:PAS domain S-box-containing protein
MQLILTVAVTCLALAFAYMYFITKKALSAEEGAENIDEAQKVLDTIGMPVMQIDTDYNIVSINTAGASLGGLNPEDYVGTKCYNLFKSDHCRTDNCALCKAMKSGQNEIARTIAKPREGLSIPIIYSGAPARNEDGKIIGAIEYVQDITSIHKAQVDVQNGSQQLGAAVQELSTMAQQVGSKTDDVTNQSTEVAASAEQMSSNFASVSSAVEETNSIFRSIASASEEMSSSINEITRSVTAASETTHEAVQHSENLEKRVQELNSASDEVSTIINTIISISEKTTLLALNATIEAARAGEYGKGFAVVASEVKDLATQTNDAISDIKGKVDNIASTSKATAVNITEINMTIDEISQNITSIASAMEEQNVTTQEIAHNTNEAVQGMNDVTVNIGEANSAAHVIAERISSINHDMKEIDTASSHLNGSAEELAVLSASLETVAVSLGE